MALADELDPRRRRGAQGNMGYEGIGGAEIQPGRMMPFLYGNRSLDFGGGIQGQGGLQAILAQLAANPGQGRGPAQSHLMNQGVQFPPGLQEYGGIGGPNVAPGNLDTGQALGQPGLGRDLAPGQQMQSQGWRNYAPGGAIAAALGYGTPDFGRNFGRGPAPAGDSGLGGMEGTRPGASDLRGMGAGPGPESGRPAPQQSRIMPSSRGTGASNTGAETPNLGRNKPGGGGGGIQAQANQQSTARGGQTAPVTTTAGVDRDRTGKPRINRNTGGVSSSQGQPLLQGPTASGPSNQVYIPNRGNNNTPSETRPPAKPKPAASAGKKKPKPKPGGGGHQGAVTSGGWQTGGSI